MLGLLNILSRFNNEFDIFNITGVQMLNSIYHDIITDIMHYLFFFSILMGRVQRTSLWEFPIRFSTGEISTQGKFRESIKRKTLLKVQYINRANPMHFFLRKYITLINGDAIKQAQ